MKRKKILVFGYFGYVTDQLDGQTVKTRSIYELVKERADADVVYADSQEFRKKPMSILLFLKNFMCADKCIILPCLNNLKYIFPILYILSKFTRTEIIHVGIGGWHQKYLSGLPIVRKMLKNIKINLLENTITCKELHDDFGFDNLKVIPNFRFEIAPKPINRKNLKLRLVFMARINIKKGLDTIAWMAKRLEEKGINNQIVLDIFGPYDSEQDKKFLETNVTNKFDWIKYSGKLAPSEIIETLQTYDVMIFPTHYYTEGFPGSILDAYRAGLPVIATNWKHARQFILEEKSGYIVDFNSPVDDIVSIVEYLLTHREDLKRMQEYAYEENFKYTANSAWAILKEYL